MIVTGRRSYCTAVRAPNSCYSPHMKATIWSHPAWGWHSCIDGSKAVSVGVKGVAEREITAKVDIALIHLGTNDKNNGNYENDIINPVGI